MQAPKSPPSVSASLAATKAFVQSRDSNASLSSAAAAAALRTHTTSPTLVGDTITKRMVRRGSTSSHGSGSAQAAGLRRHSSSGSMTERSFRAPSPSRSSPVDLNAPPVPSIPKSVPGAGVVHRRASSVDPPSRGGLSGGRGGGGRGLSLDRGVGMLPGRGQGHTSRVMGLSQVPEDEQESGRRSVNFSRPISPQQSPTPPRPATSSRAGHSGWFGGPVVNANQTFRGEPKPRPQTSSGVSGIELHNAIQSIQNAADKPVSTKRSQMARSSEGSRLSSGSMQAKPVASSIPSRPSQAAYSAPRDTPRTVDPNSPFAVYDPSTRTFIHKQDAMDLHRAISQHDDKPRHIKHHVSTSPPNQPGNMVQRTLTPPPEYIQRQESPAPQEGGRIPSPPIQSSLQAEKHVMVSPTPHAPTPPQTTPVLAKQSPNSRAEADIGPVEGANLGRKLEHTQADPQKKTSDNLTAANQDNPYPRVETAVVPLPANAGSLRGDRNHSLSPPRNAHFATMSVDLASEVKHQPPPRSVSPAKSALKPSPSVSSRNSTPLANNRRDVARTAPSEASDTMSEDGSKVGKKHARVSFEEDPVIAGVSAYPESHTPSPPTGLSASRWSSVGQEQDMNDVMKPRPALPSFGSIRETNPRVEQGESAEKVTETVSSFMSTSIGSIGEASNDHALGGILAQDFANKKATLQSHQDPLPPEVTSVEGSGYVSDSDQSDDVVYNEVHVSDSHKVESKPDPVQSILEPEPKSLTMPSEIKAPVLDLPVIAIQPATPMEKPEPKFQRPFVPGGWDDDDDEEEEESKPDDKERMVLQVESNSVTENHDAQQGDESSDDNSSIYSDAYEDLSEDGGFASIDAVVESPVLGPLSGLMSSKYADASWVAPPNSSLKHEVARETKQQQNEDTRDWNAARQHWSDLSAGQKVQHQTVESIESVEHITASPVPIAQKPQPKLAKPPIRHAQIVSESEAANPPQMSNPSRSSAQPRKSALKKTMFVTQNGEPQTRIMSGYSQPDLASSSAGEVHMRKSMRASTGPRFATSSDTHMRKSMRSNEPLRASRAPPGLAASRHSMPPMNTKPPKGALQKKNTSAATNGSKSPSQITNSSINVGKSKAPVPAYDSDSDASASSFQRQRPRVSQGMRSTMRSGPAPTMRPTPTLRSISPPAAAFPPAAALRKSMRPLSPTPEPTSGAGSRSSKFSLRSLSPAGRFRSSKIIVEEIPPMPKQSSSNKVSAPKLAKPSQSKAWEASASKTRFKSRFTDSSDSDDDVRPRTFQSRFADSDDDEDFELPAGLTPVRGIPRKAGEEDGDSTDLEDEVSDSERPAAIVEAKNFKKSERLVTNGSVNSQGTQPVAGSLRNSKHAPELPAFDSGKKSKARRGFFGLGKKKRDASQTTEPDSKPPTGTSDIPFPPAHRNRNARPLTPIGEDKFVEAVAPPSRSPKLQRRSTPQWGRSTSDSWPLPQPPKIGDEQRPQSADGVVLRRKSLRPTLSKRNSSHVSTARSITDPKSSKQVAVDQAGKKKKKFQGLRRVFGLND